MKKRYNKIVEGPNWEHWIFFIGITITMGLLLRNAEYTMEFWQGVFFMVLLIFLIPILTILSDERKVYWVEIK